MPFACVLPDLGYSRIKLSSQTFRSFILSIRLYNICRPNLKFKLHFFLFLRHCRHTASRTWSHGGFIKMPHWGEVCRLHIYVERTKSTAYRRNYIHKICTFILYIRVRPPLHVEGTSAVRFTRLPFTFCQFKNTFLWRGVSILGIVVYAIEID